MSRIEIDISKVRSCNEELKRNNLKISNVARDIFLSMGSIDSRIQARRNIGPRLKKAYDECNEIQKKLIQLEKFISNSMDRYEGAERKVENEAEKLTASWDLRMRTLIELKSMAETLGTSSSYIEYSKMFYDGEKVGDDEDEDTEEILEETNKLLKEVNEEDDDNDWSSKPAKEDIFDKFADWVTEEVTGEKASSKTQGEEIIEAQLTSMSLDEQNILADIANDYQTAFKGLASADRINEALENFEEEPVISSEYSTKGVSEPITRSLKFNSNTVIHYQDAFESELRNFNDGYKIKDVVDDDLTLVQYSSDSANASLKYWTTADEANEISTVEEYMDKLALSKDWGSRDTIKVSKIPKGTEVKHAIGTAKAQTKIADQRPGGGLQLLFSEFDTDWIKEIRSLPK